MQLVDLETDITYMYYDEQEMCYKQKFGTVKEFLQTFADYSRLYVYTLNFGVLNEKEDK